MGLIENILQQVWTILALQNMVMHGSISVLLVGLESFLESMNIKLLFLKLVFHILTKLLENNQGLETHLPLSYEMFCNGIKL